MNSTNEILGKMLASGKLGIIVKKLKGKNLILMISFRYFLNVMKTIIFNCLLSVKQRLIFRTVHSQIAKFLERHKSDLSINRSLDVVS